jgi:phytoene/squalene synthetase
METELPAEPRPAVPPPPQPPPPSAPALALREHHPTDPRWRADLLAQSRHTRLTPETPAGPDLPAAQAPPPPHVLEDDRSAEIARELLGDFAPALLLLPATERARVRTLLAWARTLFACAEQHGPEGERLAHLNRWESALEQAMAGAASGPPICLQMARENARRRWPAPALDGLAAGARRHLLWPRPATAAGAEADARQLARAVGGALLEERLNAEVNGFAAALVRLRALQRLGGAMAHGRCPLPEDEWQPPAALATAVGRECERLRPRLLRIPRGLVELPAAYRRAGVFSLLAALRLLSEIEEAGGDSLLRSPPHLGTAARVRLLARARWWFGPRLGIG